MTDERPDALPAARRRPDRRALYFGVAAVVLQVLTVVVGVQKDPNTLATLILQGVTFALGITGSYIFGRASAAEAARDIVRPHARASFRRAVSLYRALDRQRATLSVVYNGLKDEARQDGNGVMVVDLSVARWAIIGVQNLVIEQIGTAADALEDWKDLVPEEVETFTREAVDSHATTEVVL